MYRFNYKWYFYNKKYYKLNGDFHEEVLNELEARNNLKELEARHHSGVELKGAAVQA